MHASAASHRFGWSLPDALATAGPPLLFAIRLWASVCLALFIAFWLELDNPYWAGGTAAIVWQSKTDSPTYYNNCGAPEEEAAAAMKLSGATSYSLVKGWFNETIPRFTPPSEIAVLRLDGDWYDSTRVCLENLYQHVAPGGIVIVDDYYNWDGCARAVNEFLAAVATTNAVPRVRQFRDRAAYLIKPRPGQSATNGSELPNE